MAATEQLKGRLGRYARALIAPLLIWLLLAGALVSPMVGWLNSEERYDRAALREWLEESRFPDKTLDQLVADYQALTREHVSAKDHLDEGRRLFAESRVALKRDPDPLIPEISRIGHRFRRAAENDRQFRRGSDRFQLGLGLDAREK